MEEVETLNTAEDAHMEVGNPNNGINQESEGSTGVNAKILMFKISLSDLLEPHWFKIFYVRHLPWQIMLEESPTVIPKSLGFYLRCNGVPQASTWSCFAVADFHLLKLVDVPNIYFKSDSETFSREIRHVYSPDMNQAGFSDFISWEDMCDPRRGFLMENSIEVQVYLKADVPRIEYVMGPNVRKDGAEITYFFELPKVSAFSGQYTSRILNIHNMPFQLMLETTPKEEPTALGFFLVCMGNAEYPSWNCYVEAELRLMNQNNIGEACTHTLKHLFCRAQICSGFRKVISWKRFLNSKNGFIKNDTAHFEIGVRADASIVTEIQIDWKKRSRARKEREMLYTVYNLSQLKEMLFTSTFYVCNLPWRVKMTKRTSIGPIQRIRRYLSVYLQCDYDSPCAWSCKIIANINLLKNDVEECGRSLDYKFSKEKNVFGFTHFIPWVTLLDPEAGFIKNDSITVRVYLKQKIHLLSKKI